MINFIHQNTDLFISLFLSLDVDNAWPGVAVFLQNSFIFFRYKLKLCRQIVIFQSNFFVNFAESATKILS